MLKISLISLLLLVGANANTNCSECSPVNNCCSLCTNLTCEDIPNSIPGFDNCRWIDDIDIGHGRCRNVNDSHDGSGSNIPDITPSGENSGSGSKSISTQTPTSTPVPGDESSANSIFNYEWLAVPFAVLGLVV